jgi:hypothetical protein
LVDNVPVNFPLTFDTPDITSLVIHATSEDGITTKDYTVTITRPFDASIIRSYWDDVLAVNLNTATNGGYVFTDFQWTKNGKPVPGAATPYLYLTAPSSDFDRYNVLLTTGGKTLPVCRGTQARPVKTQTALLVYPNPARHTVTVENPQWEAIKQINLINLNGNIVRTYTSAPLLTIDVSGIPTGLYLVQAGAQTLKLIIE